MSGLAAGAHPDYHQPCTRRRRARRSQRPIHHIPAPSSSLLSLLATLVASLPAVDASPIPLSFLCPRYRQDFVAVDEPCSRDVSDSPTILPVPLHRQLSSRTVPIKYEQGSDGQWRRVDTYTLYGSTMCTSCSTSSYQASSGTSQDSATTSASASSSDGDILDSLPSGWRPQTHEPRTTLIVTLSLVLAFIICLLIISCLYWRNRRRRKPKGDIEMHTYKRRKQSVPDDEEMLSQGGIKKKKKIWARATARWKANARHSARQRRGKRAFSVNRSSVQLEAASPENARDPRDLSSGAVSPWSRHSSRRSSLTSVEGTQPVTIATPTEFADVSHAFPPDPTVLEIPPSSPPAYQHPSRLSVPQINICTSGLALPSDGSASSISSPLTPYYSRQPLQSSGGHRSSNKDSEEPGYSPSVHAAHVATDDKALLQRLTQSASSPPQDGNILGHNQESSAPAWQDEQLDAFIDGHRTPRFAGDGPFPVSSNSLFPAPPDPLSSKGKAVAAEYYDYDYSYSTFDEDMQSLEPELGPSAPPFEAVTSDSPVELHELVPSAPPPETDVDGNDIAEALRKDEAPFYERQGVAGETQLPLENVGEDSSQVPPHYHS
ncbi:uncharacterized protein BT62DRAFT_926426 [Guyanagaster necrorhizus]|uniref:Uncharacterized protein n=1 Tax=Guyanagaster necrorhizus TaxID=856835 RepID=A0A9P7W4X8_9AGAR|nr:uncharacterized protein BT62DRAFT_926426 [Guyanagaster necrorhizus MCA 3950]KAG7452217.1 hypothetical protein BT62DRAFT_926426 [Guyanagaster necrorhizus MCA 3950]